MPVAPAQGGERLSGSFCLLPAGAGPARSVVPCLGGPRPASRAARLAASLLDADLELPLLLPDALSRGSLEAPRLTSQHCSYPGGGSGPTAGVWGCSNSLQFGEGNRRGGPLHGSDCKARRMLVLIIREVSFPSSCRGVSCVWMDPTRPGGQGGGSSSVGFPRRRCAVGLGGWMIRFDVHLAEDMVKRVHGYDLRCVPCLLGQISPGIPGSGEVGEGCWARWFGRFWVRSGMLISAGGLAGWPGAPLRPVRAGSCWC